MRYYIFMLTLAASACGGGPTFMKVCGVADHFVYPAGDQVSSRACEAPEEIAWIALPLKVSIEPGLAAYASSFDEAFKFWERELGFSAFRRAGAGETADVKIVSGAIGDPGLAATHHHRTAGVLSATIEIRKPGDITEMYFVMAHELGHVVGLAHDPQPLSIMHHAIENVGLLDEDPDDPIPIFLVLDNDKAALRAAYGPR